ncbi:MAG: UDPGP type 1 family protein [Verrucomicrobiota bacterium]
MNATVSKEELIAAFAEKGQDQVFRYFDELDPTGQEKLLAAASKIDLDEIDQLVEEHLKASEKTADGLEGLEPAPFIASPASGGDPAQWEAARELGAAAIQAGRVAAFTVAGGQGTRLGYDGPKGTFPVTPVSGKTLFQVFAEKIARTSARYGATIHWFILTSEINNTATVDAFEANDYFGLPEDSVHFIVQGLMAAVDYDGKIILADKDTIMMTPDGHGGSLRALVRSGAVAKMKELGIDCVSYFQVDNPLIQCIDPAFVGFHLQSNSELSSKMVPKAYALEKVGLFCVKDGQSVVIEYSDMPAEMQEQTDANGALRFVAGSVAIHIFDRDFIERVGGDGTGAKLPFHRADKKIPFVSADGTIIKPDKPNGVKFEMFVFDALPLAQNLVIIEATRADDFSPVKNAEGLDSPKTSKEDQLRLYARWLKAAGEEIATDETGLPEITFEISHLFAADEADFVAQWSALETKPSISEGVIIQ